MKYTEFKERTEREFINYLPDEYKNGEVMITTVNKTNIVLDGLTVYCGDRVSPTIYIQGMYEEYMHTGSFGYAMRISAKRYVEAAQSSKNMSISLDPQKIKENVVFQIINTAANKVLLSKVPHREFEDVSFIYRWVIDAYDGEIASVVVNNNLIEQFDLCEEMLFRNAMDNTPRLLPISIQNIESVIDELLKHIDFEDDDLQDIFQDIEGTLSPMYVITNTSKQYGAGAVFYKDALHQIAEKEQKNLFLIPLSLHEMIAVPEVNKESDISVLLKMIHEVNRTQLPLSDRLSNELYFYDWKLRHFCKVSNANMSIVFTEEEQL